MQFKHVKQVYIHTYIHVCLIIATIQIYQITCYVYSHCCNTSPEVWNRPLSHTVGGQKNITCSHSGCIHFFFLVLIHFFFFLVLSIKNVNFITIINHLFI